MLKAQSPRGKGGATPACRPRGQAASLDAWSDSPPRMPRPGSDVEGGERAFSSSAHAPASSASSLLSHPCSSEPQQVNRRHPGPLSLISNFKTERTLCLAAQPHADSTPSFRKLQLQDDRSVTPTSVSEPRKRLSSSCLLCCRCSDRQNRHKPVSASQLASAPPGSSPPAHTSKPP